MTHPELVSSLVKNGDLILSEMDGIQVHRLHMAIGIAGEAGELIDAVKKEAIYQKQLDIPNVVEELGDLEFYMEGLRQSLGISRELCINANIAKLQKRYGEKYSNQAAQDRRDKTQ